MRLDVLSANIKVYYVHAGCIRRPEEGAGFSGAGVVGGRVALWVLGMLCWSSAGSASALNH